MVEFMKTKDRCLQCGVKMSDNDNILFIVTEDGKQHFCSAYCFDQWVYVGEDLK